MFSLRTAWPRAENPLTQALQAVRVVSKGSAPADGSRSPSGGGKDARGVIDLTISNPTRVGLDHDPKAVLAALARDGAMSYSPQPLGSASAREAIAAYYQRRGLDVSADRIVIVATTSEAYTFLFRLLVNPAESVAVPHPSYPLFSFLSELADVVLSPYHLRYGDRDGWRLDAASLEEAIDSTTRAIITVSPNNPTGSCLDPSEHLYLARLAASRDLALISDEVFLDYLEDPKCIEKSTFIRTEQALTFTLGGLSKLAGLPQVKLSWIVLSGPEELVLEARARLEIIGDTFLSVSTPVERALPELIALGEAWQLRMRERIGENRRALAELTGPRQALSGVRACEGGWYAMIDLPDTREDEEWALVLLEKEGIVVHPGYLFDVEDKSAIVVSTIGPPAEFRDAIRRLVDRVEKDG